MVALLMPVFCAKAQNFKLAAKVAASEKILSGMPLNLRIDQSGVVFFVFWGFFTINRDCGISRQNDHHI